VRSGKTSRIRRGVRTCAGSKPKIEWTKKGEASDFDAASSFLSLLYSDPKARALIETLVMARGSGMGRADAGWIVTAAVGLGNGISRPETDRPLGAPARAKRRNPARRPRFVLAKDCNN
jgi:hypothetical protein